MARNDVLSVQDLNIDIEKLSTPIFLVDEAKLRENLAILKSVIDRTDCRIILALKAFSTYVTFPLLREVLHGTCASSVHEARLGREYFGKEVHVYGAAYSDEDFRELLRYANHIDFNSFGLWEHFRPLALQAKKKKNIHFGIRINPEHSEGTVPIYDPAAPFSRLGVVRSEFRPDLLDGISYLHFHTLCQQNAEPLVRTLRAVEEKFGEFIPAMEYVNFGGGHHITRADYNIDLLCNTIIDFKKRYGVQVYLEPGEAVALNAGYLVATVLDVIRNGMDIAILDTSAAAHMPDVLEMPYRPHILESGLPHEKPYTYRLGGGSCLAGDVIGDYSFDRPLKRGDKLVFTDMAIYSMVKTNTFNGIKLPDIAIMDSEKKTVSIHRRFGYRDFKMRL
jgi:carboxynorspermidine decarboxylase